jgi:hypothetical protein
MITLREYQNNVVQHQLSFFEKRKLDMLESLDLELSIRLNLKSFGAEIKGPKRVGNASLTVISPNYS